MDSFGETDRQRGKNCLSAFSFIILLALICGCESNENNTNFNREEREDSLAILTWNVQTLFDGEETGNEYAEFFQAAGWNGEKYLGRLNVITQAISRIELKAPDLIALEEIETSRILTDLAGSGLSKPGYKWTYFANNPGASLGIGVLSRFPFLKTAVHSVHDKGEVIPRPVLELWIQPRGSPLVLFICHWKSKVGGGTGTEFLRRASARVILRRLREIRQENPEIPVVILGDLNENHDEFYRQEEKTIGALLPDDPRAMELAGFYARERGLYSMDDFVTNIELFQPDFLILSGNKPPEPEYFPSGTAVLFSPWVSDLQDGSYYYKNGWETIDHLILSAGFFDGAGWDYESCRVLNEPPFADREGYPQAYNPKTGTGISDHLPLLLTLRLAGAE